MCVLPPAGDLALRDNPRQRPPPLLAVEVLSPSTARQDRIVKRPRYQRTGVEYWMVDLDARVVERWTPDAERPEICLIAITWQPAGAVAPLAIDLVALFAEIVREARVKGVGSGPGLALHYHRAGVRLYLTVHRRQVPDRRGDAP
ncbi:MAG: Uma2 family endonuclease [Gemmatimonadaceae bacterium]|nr:Uma2 family endonuclease [Gemmatimonadaceae bacterium]